MIEELHRNQIGVYLDAVMNHKAGADYTEWFMAQEVDPGQRENATSEPHEIEGWTGFDFPGRGNMYSNFKWHWFHFSGTDYDVSRKKEGIFQILGEGKHWSEGVDDENGNYDYLMFADLDFSAFTEEDLDALRGMLSDEEERLNRLLRLQDILCAAKPKAAAARRFC